MNKQKMMLSISADLANTEQELLDYLKFLQENNVDYVHMDVMNGTFTPATTYNFSRVNYVNAHTIIPLDVHLMIEQPAKHIKNYARAGANILTVHKEVFQTREELVDCLCDIRKEGMLSGLALNLQTNEKTLIDVLPYVDFLTIMGVEVGASGQAFDDAIIKKIQIIDEIRTTFKMRFKICVDGGVNPTIIPDLKNVGVDMVVSSSYIYNSNEKELSLKRLRQ